MAGMRPIVPPADIGVAMVPEANYMSVIFLGNVMPPRAVPVMLTAAERKTLKRRVRGATTPHRDRVRARIVRAAARGHANERIAAVLGVGVDTVRKWRGRFVAHGLGG